jgi:hypothetical protein
VRYWYNMRTGQVQSDDERGPGENVMGPYDTKEEAARALQTARQKTEKWDAEDREWRERGAGAGGSGDAGEPD